MKLEYKPVAVQDECWGGVLKDPRIWVLIKTEAHGKKIHHKFDVKEFIDAEHLDRWLEETGLPVIPEKELRAGVGQQARFIAEASSKK